MTPLEVFKSVMTWAMFCTKNLHPHKIWQDSPDVPFDRPPEVPGELLVIDFNETVNSDITVTKAGKYTC